jgi:ribosomal-protein-alanine N-acetyltransferase
MQIETERLLLREMSIEDLPFFALLHQDLEVVRYFGGQLWTEAKTRGWLEATIAFHRELGLGQHAIVRKADGRLIGRSGLVPFAVVERDEAPAICYWRAAPAGVEAEQVLELGYTLARAAWGQGYATEAARAARDWAFRERGVERLIALIDPGNLASSRVAARLGFAARGPARFIREPGAADPHGIDVAITLWERGR